MKTKTMKGWNYYEFDEPEAGTSVCVATLSNGKEIGYLIKPWNPTIVIGNDQYGGKYTTKQCVMERINYADMSKGDKAKVTRTYNLFVAYMLSIVLSVPQQ